MWKLSNTLFNNQWVKEETKKEIRKYLKTERADSRNKNNTILQPVEQKPHSQKDRQNEKAEGYVPNEGTR